LSVRRSWPSPRSGRNGGMAALSPAASRPSGRGGRSLISVGRGPGLAALAGAVDCEPAATAGGRPHHTPTAGAGPRRGAGGGGAVHASAWGGQWDAARGGGFGGWHGGGFGGGHGGGFGGWHGGGFGGGHGGGGGWREARGGGGSGGGHGHGR